MTMPRISLLLVIFIAGCNSSDIPKSVPKTATADRLFDMQRHALEQSKKIQLQVDQQAEAQRKALDQQNQ
ncbi:MAG: hypothetical protein WC426_13235 [Sulfuriferula sp.]